MRHWSAGMSARSWRYRWYDKNMLIDTHCHIHDPEFFTAEAAEEVYVRARAADVAMLCIGTSQPDSRVAVEFTKDHDKTWAVIGVHPHEAKDGVADIGRLLAEKHPSVVGIGEIGLDYYYNHSAKAEQIAALEQQLQWAVDYDLPVSFHVREAYDDFWPVLDNFHGIRGTLHSFTDSQANLDKGFERGLYVSVNGISTFTKDATQQELFARVPLEKMLLETDAPFLTPTPYRGTINEPTFVREIATFHAKLRGISLRDVAAATTANANALFRINA